MKMKVRSDNAMEQRARGRKAAEQRSLQVVNEPQRLPPWFLTDGRSISVSVYL